jgi:hypothetical protein
MIKDDRNSNRKGLCCYFKKWVAMYFKNGWLCISCDRLYVMLNKIHFYREAKGISADLVLIIFDIEEVDDENKRPDRSERVLDFFQPAIANKLLKVEHFKVSQKEISEFEVNGQQKLF